MKQKRERRDCQKAAVDYALDVGDPAFFVQMRIGKTVMAIDSCNALGANKVLVVAPTSALYSWEDELEMEGETSYCYLLGKAKEKTRLLEDGDSRWYLLNKEGHLAFHSSEEHGRRTTHYWDDVFTTEPEWDAVILDESTFIRYPKTLVSKCFTQNFRDVPHRMILSGMPNPESELDFFQQFLFLDGGETFGNNYWRFRATNFIEAGYQNWLVRTKARERIAKAVSKRAFVVRRKDVALEVPIVYEKRFAVLPSKLREAYTKAEEEFLLEYDGSTINRTLYKIAVYMWTRHLSSGFVDGELKWTGKIDLLLELLSGELRGQPVIVWFDFNEGLFACRRWLLASGYSVRSVVGKPYMSVARRKISIRDWKNGRAQVLLAQPRCLQYGVNLSRADVEIFFTSPLSNELRTQSLDRIIDVTDKHPRLCIDLVTKDTVDEDIAKKMQRKHVKSFQLLDACSSIRRRRQKHGRRH